MTRRRWTSRDIGLLRERYPVEGPGKLTEELGRSEDSISSFARRCGLRTSRRPYRRKAQEASIGSGSVTATRKGTRLLCGRIP